MPTVSNKTLHLDAFQHHLVPLISKSEAPSMT
uniref:Uncharacterized protein n=1 Tax=Anguilla anguilla TaxID=7936 RepID=A0A0E9UPP1_ANGAN